MDYLLPMGVVQRRCNLAHDGEGIVEGEPALAGQALAE